MHFHTHEERGRNFGTIRACDILVEGWPSSCMLLQHFFLVYWLSQSTRGLPTFLGGRRPEFNIHQSCNYVALTRFSLSSNGLWQSRSSFFGHGRVLWGATLLEGESGLHKQLRTDVQLKITCDWFSCLPWVLQSSTWWEVSLIGWAFVSSGMQKTTGFGVGVVEASRSILLCKCVAMFGVIISQFVRDESCKL